MTDKRTPEQEASLRLDAEKFRLDISQQEHNIRANNYRKLEIEIELARIQRNTDASHNAIKEMNESLAKIEESL